MSDQSFNESTGNQSTGNQSTSQGGSDQVQPSKNPLLNRPSNPQLDILARKGSDKPIQESQKRERIIEQKKEGNKPTKDGK